MFIVKSKHYYGKYVCSLYVYQTGRSQHYLVLCHNHNLYSIPVILGCTASIIMNQHMSLTLLRANFNTF
jgi:hypothetical protein